MLLRGIALLLLSSSVAATAQTTCSSAALDRSAATVLALRHQLRTRAVPVDKPTVPPDIAAQLTQLKNSLASATEAVFGCAPPHATAATFQTTLVNALHASPEGTEIITGFGRDRGPYAAGLFVQVVPLFDSPQTFEVDLRYTIECGDDNVILLFQANNASSGSDQPAFRELLRLSSPAYTDVRSALGDFFLLTPLTGNPDHPDWRFVVAHGQPGCTPTPRPSTFTLDLLRPTADPSHPATDWHFTHPYTQSASVTPRLATTEDTIEFSLVPEAKTTKPFPPENYRFHLTATGKIEPTIP